MTRRPYADASARSAVSSPNMPHPGGIMLTPRILASSQTMPWSRSGARYSRYATSDGSPGAPRTDMYCAQAAAQSTGVATDRYACASACKED